MQTLDWEKVDKFYIALAVVLVLMSVLLIFSFRGIFSAYLNSQDLGSAAETTEMKVQRESLDEAYEWVFNKNTVQLGVIE